MKTCADLNRAGCTVYLHWEDWVSLKYYRRISLVNRIKKDIVYYIIHIMNKPQYKLQIQVDI